MQFDEFFFCYKDIRRKAFFTMATLLMLLLENGVLPVQDEAPVPPSCPEIKICSLLPLATPEATTPTPTSETSLTEILATGFEHFRS